jgi:hypothetical protein
MPRYFEVAPDDDGKRGQASSKRLKTAGDRVGPNMNKKAMVAMMMQEFHVLEIKVNHKQSVQVLGPESRWMKVSLPCSQGFG